MPVLSRSKLDEEPIGIVISRGKREETPPAFWAYVWAPAPEGPEPKPEPKAA